MKPGRPAGFKMSEETKKRVSESKKGKIPSEQNFFWKGENAKYGARHMWIILHKGKPNHCSFCGKTELRPRQYNWANIDHKYRRNLDDYIRLCASCHQKYDIENNNYCGGKRKKIYD
jgi:hypothetical protein